MAFNGTALLKNHPTSTRKHRPQAKKKAATMVAALKLGGERGITLRVFQRGGGKKLLGPSCAPLFWGLAHR